MDDRLTSLALILKVLAFAVWTTTTSLMFLPPKRHQKILLILIPFDLRYVQSDSLKF